MKRMYSLIILRCLIYCHADTDYFVKLQVTVASACQWSVIILLSSFTYRQQDSFLCKNIAGFSSYPQPLIDGKLCQALNPIFLENLELTDYLDQLHLANLLTLD